MTEKTVKETKRTVANEIWDEISELPIAMFALPNQKVKDHLEMIPIPGKVLFAKPKSPAVTPSLEEAIGSGFAIEVTGKGYLQISRVQQMPEIDEEYVTFQRGDKVEKIKKSKYLGSDS